MQELKKHSTQKKEVIRMDEKFLKILWHYSATGRQARRNYLMFQELVADAIKQAPATVKFTSPDIEKLEKENAELKQKLSCFDVDSLKKREEREKELKLALKEMREALEFYAEVKLIGSPYVEINKIAQNALAKHADILKE